MLGISDFWVALAYLLCLLSTLISVVYGALLWNKGKTEPPTDEMVEWAKEEDEIGAEL